MTTNPPPPQRTQIPNIVDDLGLDPYERALYVHYKRICGENQGAYCFEATRTTAQKVKMSVGQVSEARKQLATKGLIIVQDGRPVVVTIVNIWEMNTDFYQLEHRPDIDGWTVEQVKLWLSDVHIVNVNSHNESNLPTRNEHNLTECSNDVHTVNGRSYSEINSTENNNMSTYVHGMKQRIESINSESNKERESRPREKPGPLALSLAKICLINLDTVTNGARKKYFDALNILIDTKATAEQVKGFGEWWKTNWRGKNGSPPLPNQVCDLWGEFQAGYQPRKVSISAK